MAHEFAAQEIRPVAWEYDRDGTWPQAIIEKAWEVGPMNPPIPEAYGGAGASAMEGVLIEEELGWGCSGIGTSISSNGLASAPVLLGGSEQIKKTYLGMLTEAPKLASFCLTEPDAGSDVSGMRTRAVKRGESSEAPTASDPRGRGGRGDAVRALAGPIDVDRHCPGEKINGTPELRRRRRDEARPRAITSAWRSHAAERLRLSRHLPGNPTNAHPNTDHEHRQPPERNCGFDATDMGIPAHCTLVGARGG